MGKAKRKEHSQDILEREILNGSDEGTEVHEINDTADVQAEQDDDNVIRMNIPSKKKDQEEVEVQEIPEQEVKTEESKEVQDEKLVKVEDYEIYSEEHGTGRLKFFVPEEAKKRKGQESNKVQVIDKNANVQNVSPKDLKEIIRTTKDIQQVIIEQIRMMDATRVRLVFDLENDLLAQEQSAKFIDDSEVSQKKISDSKSAPINLAKLEEEVNKEFIEDKPGATKVQVEKPDVEVKQGSVHTIESQDSSQERRPERQKEKTKDEPTNLLRLKDEIDDSGRVKHSRVEEEKLEEDNVEYSRHVFLRKQKKKKLAAKYFYQAKNHQELYKVGSSYLVDFNKGLKSFAFNSMRLEKVRQKTVFGVAAFLGYQAGIQSTIITNKWNESFYSTIIEEVEEKEDYIFSEKVSYKYYSTKDFKIVTMEEITRAANEFKQYNVEDFLEVLIDDAECVLWDLPELKEMDKEKQIYFPVIRNIDHVSLVVAENNSKMKEIHTLIEYYRKYGVFIKGIILDAFN